jgi:hypothetical protein
MSEDQLLGKLHSITGPDYPVPGVPGIEHYRDNSDKKLGNIYRNKETFSGLFFGKCSRVPPYS